MKHEREGVSPGSVLAMRWGLAVVLGCAVLTVAGCGDDGTDRLEDAADACEAATGNAIDTSDDGKTIAISTSDFRRPRSVTEASTCVMTELDVPTSIKTKMGSTTSLMGRQEDSWGSFDVSWTYHPDDGLEIVVELAD